MAANNLAAVYVDHGRYDEAEPLIAAAVTHGRRSLPQDHWRMGVLLKRHGECLMRLGRYGEGEVLLLEAHQVFEGALGTGHDFAIKTIEALAELYDAWGKPEKALEYRGRPPSPTGASAAARR